jgi:hypothetical protein
MREIHYKKGSMSMQAIGCAGLAAGCAWAAINIDIFQIRLFCGLMAVSLPFLAVALFRRAMGPGLAFSFDSSSLIVTSLFRHAVIPWGNIQSITRETLQQSTAFGLVKQDVAKEIAISFYENGDIRKFKVNEALLDVPKDSIDAMLEDMVRYGRTTLQSPMSVTSQSYYPSGSARSNTIGPIFGRK